MTSVMYINSTDVRKDFSATLDNVIHEKPQFVKRTHNRMIFIEEGEFNRLFSSLMIPVKIVKEKDGSFIATNSVMEDVFSTGKTKEEAIDNLCDDLIEYAADYYADYELYSKAPNRKNHAAYVMRIISSPSNEEVKEILYA